MVMRRDLGEDDRQASASKRSKATWCHSHQDALSECTVSSRRTSHDCPSTVRYWPEPSVHDRLPTRSRDSPRLVVRVNRGTVQSVIAQSRTSSPVTRGLTTTCSTASPTKCRLTGEHDFVRVRHAITRQFLPSTRSKSLEPIARLARSFNSAAPPPPIDHGCLWKLLAGESATLTNSLCDPGWSI